MKPTSKSDLETWLLAALVIAGLCVTAIVSYNLIP